MKIIPIAEAGPQIKQLALDAIKGELVVLAVGGHEVELRPRDADEDEYDPELEAELLKGLEGTPTPYSEEETKRACYEALAKSMMK